METNTVETPQHSESPLVNLSVGDIISNGISIQLKNFVTLLGAAILSLITIWIPYLNVGTTIALFSIVIGLSQDRIISPVEIFDKKYRKYIGEFFILFGLMYIGIMVGYVFFIIPGLVIAVSWCLAIYLFLDYELAPLQAIMLSNKITYGYKWKIFWGLFVIEIIMYVVFLIVYYIFSLIHDFVGVFFGAIVLILILPVMLGAMAYIYKTLKLRVPEFKK